MNRARGERPGTVAALPITHALQRTGALGDDTVATGDITLRIGNRDESARQPTPDCDESIGLAVASDLPVSWTVTARQTEAGECTAGPAASGGAGRTAGNS